MHCNTYAILIHYVLHTTYNSTAPIHIYTIYISYTLYIVFIYVI